MILCYNKSVLLLILVKIKREPSNYILQGWHLRDRWLGMYLQICLHKESTIDPTKTSKLQGCVFGWLRNLQIRTKEQAVSWLPGLRITSLHARILGTMLYVLANFGSHLILAVIGNFVHFDAPSISEWQQLLRHVATCCDMLWHVVTCCDMLWHVVTV